MREILFRGKRKDNGEWVEGDSLIHSMFKKGDVCVGVVEGMEIYSAIPETVGQYTGLTDKNGKKIFEGDIVEFCGIKGVINYGTGCFCVKTNKPDWRGRNNPAIDIVLNEYENELKVIGNIHDTPNCWKARLIPNDR